MSQDHIFSIVTFITGMNAAVRAVVRMGIACGSKMYLIHEVRF